MNQLSISQLYQKILVDIQVHENDGIKDQITFITKEGDSFELLHHQDCCESVYIEDIVGDIKDLLGTPLLIAEEASNQDSNLKDHISDSFTWTFYKFATKKGYVDIRWLGTSNGYYSESVDFIQGKKYSLQDVQQLITKNKLKIKLPNQPHSEEFSRKVKKLL